MEIVVFSCVTPEGQLTKSTFLGQSVEMCLDVLNQLVHQGWQLISAKIGGTTTSFIELPVEAFDGNALAPSLSGLQHEWERLLIKNTRTN